MTKKKSKITAPQGDKLNRMAVDFEEIKSKVEFNTELYKLTLTSIEKTRVEAARKLKVLSVISSPQLPQESSFPNIPLFDRLLVTGVLPAVRHPETVAGCY